MRIEIKRVGPLDSLQVMAEFRADESRSSVSGVYVEPNIFRTADRTQFLQIVIRARRRRSQSAHHLFQFFLHDQIIKN